MQIEFESFVPHTDEHETFDWIVVTVKSTKVLFVWSENIYFGRLLRDQNIVVESELSSSFIFMWHLVKLTIHLKLTA